MGDTTTQLGLIINVNPDIAEEELAQLTKQLRQEIEELDVERVDLAKREHVPAGTKTVGPVTWGTLLVTLAASGGVITQLISTLQAWLTRHGQRSITLEIDGDKLEVAGISAEEQQRLIEEWMTRHKLILTP